MVVAAFDGLLRDMGGPPSAGGAGKAGYHFIDPDDPRVQVGEGGIDKERDGGCPGPSRGRRWVQPTAQLQREQWGFRVSGFIGLDYNPQT